MATQNLVSTSPSALVKSSSAPEYLYLGTNRHHNQHPVYWPENIHAHHLCTGSTGSGKSFYLMLLAEIFHQSGANLFVIEPHKTLISNILRSLSKRLSSSRRTIVFAPFAPNQKYLLGFQPFPRDIAPDKQWFVALSLVEAILTAFGERYSFQSPRTARILYNICLPVLASGRGVLGIEAFLDPAKKADRRAMLKCLSTDHAHVISDWELFDSLTPTRQSEFLEGPANRLRFLLMPTVKRLFAHPKPLDLAKILEGKGITFLFDLSRYNCVTRDIQRLIGILFLQELYRLGLGRNVENPQHLTTNHILVDEANLFLSESTAYALEELRKAKLFYSIALQGLAQSRKESDYLLESLLTNTRIKTVFRVNSPDAEILAREMERSDPYRIKEQERIVRYKPVNVLQEVISKSFSETSSESFVKGMSHTTGDRATYTAPDVSNPNPINTGTNQSHGYSDSHTSGKSVTTGHTSTMSPVTIHEEVTEWKNHYFPLQDSIILAAQNLQHQGVGECVLKVDNQNAVHLKVKHIEPAHFHPHTTPLVINHFLAMVATAWPEIYLPAVEVETWMNRFDDISLPEILANNRQTPDSVPAPTSTVTSTQDSTDQTPDTPESAPRKRGLFKRR